MQFLVYALSGFLPRDPDWWVFGSWSGKLKGDNAGALFHYVGNVPDGPRVTWISASSEIVSRLQQQGVEAHKRWSWSGVWACLRSGVYVYDGLTRDINHWLSRGADKVLLRHGIGFKRVERAIDNPAHRLFKLFHGSPLQRTAWSILIPWHLVRPTLVLATSEDHADQGVEFFGIGRDQIIVTGFPRHDVMFRDIEIEMLDLPERSALEAIRNDARPTFLFMPTLRDTTDRQTMSWDELNRQAGRAGVTIFVKLHPADSFRRMGRQVDQRSWENLSWVDPAADPSLLYRDVYGLITDFSSAANDILLLRKPIIFFVPDRPAFEELRSLYYPFEEVAPGPRCTSLEDLGDALSRAVTEGIGDWVGMYEEVLDRFHLYRDGQSAKRAYQAIRQSLASV